MKRVYLTLLALCICVSAIFAQTTVTVQSNTFTPQDLTINVGETVLFDNINGFHNVDGTQTTFPSNPESFGNGAAASAPWNYEHTFTIAGTYDYNCTPHAGLGMVGTITVLGGATDDVVISEIMYNPPESGQDSLEFIEIYNKGADAVDLEGWTLSGAEFTFPAISIGAGEYLVTCINSTAIASVFGLNTDLQWTDGALSNGGEILQILNAAGVVIDEVDYNNSGEWPSSPNGDGNSLVLCDVNSDNSLGASWLAASTATGVIINDTEVFANPGAASACPNGPIVGLGNTGFTITESDMEISVDVSISLGNADDTAVDVVLSATSTATENDDFTFSNQTITFAGGTTSETQQVAINLIDDVMPEGTETIIIELVNATNGAVLGTTVFTLEIEDNDTEVDYQEVTIAMATETDAEGAGTMVGNLVQIQGVVYGVNMTNNGIQFTIIDENNDGIGVYNEDDNLGYTVIEGDEVILQGTVSQFNGLLQINPDVVDFVNTGNILFDPTIITEYNEDMESQLVRIENVTLVDINNWTSGGTGFNVEVTDGINTYDLRIDNNIDLFDLGAPTGTFNVTGIGGQFDSSSPFDGGYQLLPRYMEDITPYNEMPPVEPEFPTYNIIEVTGQNADGVADSINITCTLTGIVHGIDFRGGEGIQFMIHDETDGIFVFSFDNNTYTPTAGDEITIEGSISQSVGITQINPNVITLNSQNNSLPSFNVFVSNLGEAEESEYGEFYDGTFTNPAQWTPAGAGFNMDYELPTGEVISMRIDNDSPLFLLPTAPQSGPGTFFTGVVSQFDTSEPFTDVHEFLAIETSFHLNTNYISLGEKINIFPNPAQDILNVETGDVVLDNIRITNMLGQTVLDVNSPANRLNINNLPAGIYTVTFTTENRFYSEQLIKK